MRETEALSIPRNSSGRGRVANERIDAILYALTQGESYGGRTPGGGMGVGRGRGRGSETAAGSSAGGSEGHESCSVPSHSLSDEEVEAVIMYVDTDQSGEVDAEVGWGRVGVRLG